MPNRSQQPVDLVVVGAGVIGLACAWRAAQRGMSVRVLERDHAGSGASGVAAGMLAPVGEATWGEEGLLGLALAAHGAWPGFAAELADAAGLDVEFLGLGALHAAFDRDEARELRRRYELMQQLGLEAEWLSPSAARELEPGLSPRCAGAVHAAHESAVDPRALVRALRAAAERGGAGIVTGAEVVGVLGGDGAIEGVRTGDGSKHAATAVLLAAGAWSAAGWLPEFARPPVRPVKGQILTLRGSGPAPCERLVLSERVYMVPRAGGSLVVGATVEERGFDTAVTAGGIHELLREAYRALPDIAELELVETAAGLRPGTPDNAPLVGPGALPGLHLATGHYRNGVLMAPITAAAVAAGLAGEDPGPALAVANPARFGTGDRREVAPR